jgi:CelD/BcsL family acetyltransferase involved in cellulose biosynthesis
VYKALWQQFSAPSAPWDVIVLSQFLSTSPALEACEKFAQADGWRTGRWQSRPSPFIPLRCEYDDLLARLKTKERYNLRRRFNKLAELGEIDMEVIESRSAVAAAMADGLKIEAAAWKGRAGTAIISDSAVQQFYLKFAEQAADLGWLKLTFLRVNGKRIAFHYILDTGGIVYGMKMGYDPEYNTYAPGHTLLTLILQYACDNGRREFDFLGTDDAWKMVWTKETRTQPWLFLFRDGVKGRLLHRLKFSVIPAVRRNERLMRLLNRT